MCSETYRMMNETTYIFSHFMEANGEFLPRWAPFSCCRQDFIGKYGDGISQVIEGWFLIEHQVFFIIVAFYGNEP